MILNRSKSRNTKISDANTHTHPYTAKKKPPKSNKKKQPYLSSSIKITNQN
jgi:hypothetical protein